MLTAISGQSGGAAALRAIRQAQRTHLELLTARLPRERPRSRGAAAPHDEQPLAAACLLTARGQCAAVARRARLSTALDAQTRQALAPAPATDDPVDQSLRASGRAVMHKLGSEIHD